MSVFLSVPSFSLFSFILRFFFISFCLYLSFYAVVFLVSQYKWKANGQRKKKKNRLHCFPAHLTYKKDAKRRSNRLITQEDDTNGEVNASSLLLCIPSASLLFCFSCSSSHGIPYNCSRLHSSSDLLSHPSTAGNSKEGRTRESKEWAGEKVTKVASSVPHLLAICAWHVHTLGLTLPPSFWLVLRVSVSNYLLFLLR